MNHIPTIRLQKGKDQAVRRFHPWIFSGALQQLPTNLTPGSLVNVTDANGQLLGTAFYEGGTIALKMLSFGAEPVDEGFWRNKLNKAISLRRELGFLNNPHTNAFRLVHGEGDGLPGLVVDVYGSTAVLQAQSAGMYESREMLANLLFELMKGRISAVYDKSAEALGRMEHAAGDDAYLIGEQGESLVFENSARFQVDWVKGQKTGFFLDQRDARRLLESYSKDKRVLNTFSYSGGFSVFACRGGARQVVSVDSSRRAIELCDQNIALNGFAEVHESVCMDAKKYLETLQGNEFDVIVLDPPAFAKNHHNRHKGLQGYKYINYEAIRKLRRGGLLFTFSCSQAVDAASFQAIVMAAAIEAGREVQLLHHLSQPADHPVSIFHPEGAYLKGLVLRV